MDYFRNVTDKKKYTILKNCYTLGYCCNSLLYDECLFAFCFLECCFQTKYINLKGKKCVQGIVFIP